MHWRSALAVVAALGLPLRLAAQAGGDPQGMRRLIAYLQPEPGFDAADLPELDRLARTFADRAAGDSARRVAASALAHHWLRAAGADTAGSAPLLAGMLPRVARGGYRIGPDAAYASTPIGTLPEVQVLGSGPTTLILIPEFRKDWTIHRPFMEANAQRFTSLAFSLPGYGGTPPYPLPRTAAYGERAWLEGVATAVERLIVARRLRRPILVGSLSAGTYVAVRVAARRPELVGGIVLLNGVPLEEGLAGAAPEPEREARAGVVSRSPSVLLSTLFTRLAPSPESVAVLAQRPIHPRNPIRYYTADSAAMQSIYRMHLGFRPFLERYYFEWLTADLRADLAALRVPVLVVAGAADDDAPQRTDRSTHGQWARFLAATPAATVQVVPFEGVRGLIALDAPLELGDAIAAFAAGRPVPARRRTDWTRRAAPRASLTESVGRASVTVTWGRLRVPPESTSWAPRDSLWNPGADEATTIAVTQPVTIAGAVLAAGHYSLTVAPDPGRWRLAFNRSADRWGTTDYEPALDAAVVWLEPVAAPHAEWLGWTFEPQRAGATDLLLRAGRITLRLPVTSP